MGHFKEYGWGYDGLFVVIRCMKVDMILSLEEELWVFG